MSRSFRALLALAPAFVMLGACASEDKNPGFDAGVDQGAQFGNLTPDQKVTICKNQAAYVHARVDTTSLTRFLCAFTPAVFGAPDDATCEANLAQCVNAFTVKVDVQAGADPTPIECTTAVAAQCNGTVGDYENCVDALADVQITIGTDFACGKRQTYADGPTAGLDVCKALGPTCTSVSNPPVIR